MAEYPKVIRVGVQVLTVANATEEARWTGVTAPPVEQPASVPEADLGDTGHADALEGPVDEVSEDAHPHKAPHAKRGARKKS
jgi:hypothetical protein